MNAPAPRLEILQALRLLAATLVFYKHALYEIDLISAIDFNFGNYNYFPVGIDIFFVLSGFIMIYISHNKPTGIKQAIDFFVRRVIRIVPIYWFYTVVTAIIAIALPHLLGKAEFIPLEFVKSLFFIPYLNSAGDMQPLLANGWTLNYEMYFYLIFAVCLLLPVRYGVWVMVGYFMFTVYSGFDEMDHILPSFYKRFIVLEFAAGAIIGWLFLKDIRLPAAFIWVGVLFLVLSVLALFYTDTLLAHGIKYNRPLVAVLSVALLILPKGAEHIKMPRWSVFGGDMSYTLYLAHPFAIGAVTQATLFTGLENIMHPWGVFIAICIVCYTGSALAYLWIEKPVTNTVTKAIKKAYK